MRPAVAGLSLGLVLVPVAAMPAADVFMQAASFALTGSDTEEVVAIVRADCIFRVGGGTYYLNNVHLDRLNIQSWKNGFGHRWVTIDLRGDTTVYESVDPGLSDEDRYESNPDIQEFNKLMRERRPDLFKPRLIKASEKTLRLDTDEYDRVVRAWQYLYANGCVGKASPF